jgi:integrase
VLRFLNQGRGLIAARSNGAQLSAQYAHSGSDSDHGFNISNELSTSPPRAVAMLAHFHEVSRATWPRRTASELLSDYRNLIHPSGEGLCRIFSPATGSTRPRTDTELPTLSAGKEKTGRANGRARNSSLAVLFCEDTEAQLSGGRSSLSESTPSSADYPTQEEAVRLIDSASNLFHRAMLMTLYSTGMRRAELCHLKVEASTVIA